MKMFKFAVASLIVPASICLAQEAGQTTAPAVETAAPVVVAEPAQETAPAVMAVAGLGQVTVPVEMEKTRATTTSLSLDLASGTFTDDGFRISDNAVLIPEIIIETEFFDGKLPLEFGVWANYNLHEGRENGASKDHGFSEIDLSVGTAFNLGEGLDLGVSLISWQYPNMIDWNGEELIQLNLAQSFYSGKHGTVTLGAIFEYMLTGDSDNNMALRPYAKYALLFDEDSNFGIELAVQPSYMIQEGGVDAWTACVLSAQVNYCNFYAYAKYYAQMLDKIYTDEMYDDAKTVVGVGYCIEL